MVLPPCRFVTFIIADTDKVCVNETVKSVACSKIFCFLSTVCSKNNFIEILQKIFHPVNKDFISSVVYCLQQLRKGITMLEAQNRRPALPAGSRHCNDRVLGGGLGEAETVLSKAIRLYGVCWHWIRKKFRFLCFRLDTGGSHPADQYPPAEFCTGQAISGQRQDRLRARTQLLFLPRRDRCMSDWRISSGGRLIKVQIFLLYHRNLQFCSASCSDDSSAVFCGPFGWFQELLHKIPSPKLSPK